MKGAAIVGKIATCKMKKSTQEFLQWSISLPTKEKVELLEISRDFMCKVRPYLKKIFGMSIKIICIGPRIGIDISQRA